MMDGGKIRQATNNILALPGCEQLKTESGLFDRQNTGKSGVISSDGSIISETKWWEPDVISTSVPLMNTLTTFAQYGDILGRKFFFFSASSYLSLPFQKK